MSVESISALAPALTGNIDEARAQASSGADFGAWLERSVGDANDKQVRADQLVQKLALGDAENLHQVMIALDEAKFSFNLLVQVRNKLLEAYQDVMRMQV